MSGMFDLAIVGGGPAGQAAAEIACAAGLSVVMLDEQPRMGGQILRQPPRSLKVRDWLPGVTYRDLKAQLHRAEALDGLDWRGGVSVLGLFPRPDGLRLLASGRDGRQILEARHVLVAAGCYDMPVAFPGWTLPGVMSAGGVQAFIKSQQIVPGSRFVLSGTHPLQLLVADQLRKAGAEVAAVHFAQSMAAMAGQVLRDPLLPLGHPRPFRDAAAAFANLRRAGVPVRFGQRLVRARGSERLEAAEFADGTTIACDVLATCYGFLPQADLLRQAGCAMQRCARTGGFAAKVDRWQCTSIAGLGAAGETTGVAGAEVALREGRLAAIGVLLSDGLLSESEAEGRAAPIRRELGSLQRFADLLARIADPREAIAGLADDATILCRCEDVTRGALIRAISATAGPEDASALKLVSRAGMGVCQGRSCEHAVRALLAEHGAAPGSGFTARFPARPVAIADLID
ncbi:pyruvate/2-oxoglutarate dehydrogenase complex dihydrolipoamide dehydrogenase (E3) component [Blastomonas natatoria]|uniref:Pyruvate/2-oxoglutarate dehydrogenase complex dihydrolipoamide dehydrogenase (E3) component n=1 Tax=Blastomonas natatoria TaxID=34015 RepID=A0A2V3V0F9_9SPHN|nr:NAD(P)/FAD-dependent oxidoreductase [Blastomonas natatoria]PXW74441.1 pyruvate/2-oxoglutarate dehydrogenase complex dihydrolipoamide dehydrogenase (E3) component [Blastomonas natatoria]